MFADSRRATDMPRPIKRSEWVNTSGAIKSDTVFYNRLHEHTEVPFHIAENPTDSKKQPSIFFAIYLCEYTPVKTSLLPDRVSKFVLMAHSSNLGQQMEKFKCNKDEDQSSKHGKRKQSDRISNPSWVW